MKGFGGGNGIARQADRAGGSLPIRAQPACGVTGRGHDDSRAARTEHRARPRFTLLDAEQAALAEKVKPLATDGRFEQFKSTQNFDGPVHRRQHGFTT